MVVVLDCCCGQLGRERGWVVMMGWVYCDGGACDIECPPMLSAMHAN